MAERPVDSSPTRHGRTSAREAIAAVTEEFHEHDPAERVTTGEGPLDWAGYAESRARAAARTGEEESVVYGLGTIGEVTCVVLSFEFGYLGGSLGRRTGDRVVGAHRLARAHGFPLVSLVATGGSRMQEGMVALTQLQRVAKESVLLRDAGVAQVAVVRDPTTGGGWATLGAGADVILALPGAQVAFAGSRVRPAGADPAAYTAEGQYEAGQVDAVVSPDALRETLTHWVLALSRAHSFRPAPVPDALSDAEPPATGWEAVRRARDPERPRADAYLDAYFTYRVELSGDRCGGGRDPGTRCGLGLRGGLAYAYVAQCGTATLPAGYRTAARTIRLADRLGIPVLTLVDTPGAANGADAERAGQGAAIADAFAAVAAARVPVTTLVVGEGGSGGALALTSPDNTWVTADSYYSVIAPELAAAILKRGPADVEATADQLKIRPQDLVELGIARGIVRRRNPPVD
ncbi:carboxyl transferase domain-containing protein [Streptomyces sp. NPDC050504]|uniref:carboxyl transferase domain-containing protein n=1 Tax=Streptomyces sp. NPDC050504 TaxID=3365618 RepID=UPI00378EB15E